MSKQESGAPFLADLAVGEIIEFRWDNSFMYVDVMRHRTRTWSRFDTWDQNQCIHGSMIDRLVDGINLGLSLLELVLEHSGWYTADNDEVDPDTEEDPDHSAVRIRYFTVRSAPSTTTPSRD